MCQFFRMICSLNDTFWVTATKTLTWNTVQALTRLPQWVNPTWHFYLPHLIVTYLCTMRFEEMHWTALLVKYWLVHVYVWIFFSMFSGLFKAGSSQKRIRHTAHCGCALCSVSNFLESHTVCYILMTAVYKRCFHISLSEALSTIFFQILHFPLMLNKCCSVWFFNANLHYFVTLQYVWHYCNNALICVTDKKKKRHFLVLYIWMGCTFQCFSTPGQDSTFTLW